MFTVTRVREFGSVTLQNDTFGSVTLQNDTFPIVITVTRVRDCALVLAGNNSWLGVHYSFPIYALNYSLLGNNILNTCGDHMYHMLHMVVLLGDLVYVNSL